MNITLEFDNDANTTVTGWFSFDPVAKLGWSLEETVARLCALAVGQAVFGVDDMKSVFNVAGWIRAGNGKCAFALCDWREDKEVHVMVGPGLPAGLQKARFVIALQVMLQKVTPKGFSTKYYNSEDVFSWPPSPSKEDALALAIDALNGILRTPKRSLDLALAPTLQRRVEEARKALLRAFIV